ncbi:MAG: hypothetical protein NT139_00980 [Candidatus Woesearchaeota archaeon]|nr:hypothetical protein [Candidatus Woesearchaeota archaeon]
MIFLIGCNNNLPQQVIENPKIQSNVVLENKTVNIEINTTIENVTQNKSIQNITQPISNETKLPENTYKIYLNDKINYDYKTIILQNIDTNGEVTISVDNVTWIIYQTKLPDIINGLEIQTLEINLKENYVILEIKPFVLKQNRYLFYKGNTLPFDNITNITLIDINSDDSILLRILNKIDLVDDFKIPEGDSITANNLTITNIKAYKRELGYENHAIIRIVKS